MLYRNIVANQSQRARGKAIEIRQYVWLSTSTRTVLQREPPQGGTCAAAAERGCVTWSQLDRRCCQRCIQSERSTAVRRAKAAARHCAVERGSIKQGHPTRTSFSYRITKSCKELQIIVRCKSFSPTVHLLHLLLSKGRCAPGTNALPFSVSQQHAQSTSSG